MFIVMDSSTLILLAKVGLLRTVVSLHDVVIPQSVARESTRKATWDAHLIARLMEDSDVEVSPVPKREIAKVRRDMNLGAGEAAACLLAVQREGVLATDDKRAINSARVLGVPFAAAIHFLLNLFEEGFLERTAALEKLEGLARYGRYSQRILDDARARIEGGDRQ